ncbi:PssD/Cps14F family polysaccharide biosynthesis glycosyltransferase [Sphingosinicella xenopeptidilytica]|uniref:PssD/Cps14F family polysaccharide biosynthesis glycosyltransferase n=1 Tax=Sphingosinicella xenopeptidilytica TaxID=364098 RepID=A0ABW3C435_SPHXN
MRPTAILLIYGEGGHRAQMKRLYELLKPGLEHRGLLVVGICENDDALDGFPSHSQNAVRDKHSHLKSLMTAPLSFVHSVNLVVRLVFRYRIVGMVSTGPGIAVVPAMLLKLMRTRIIFLESWSRFETSSLTGRIMYRLADRFYIQNRNLKKHYPDAIYGGLL